MNKLMLWISICVSFSACTNWPRQGYFENTTIHTEERVQFKQHYSYLNLHVSVANLRGAKKCTPAYVKAVENINSRVEKAIAVEDPQDIKIEMAILERNITDLIVNLNRVSANTNCAQPPRSFTSNFVHPLTYQLDLLLYCAPQFEVDSAVLTALYKVCLRQISFLLLDNPDVEIEYTKYKLFESRGNPIGDGSNINYNQSLVFHDVSTIVDVNNEFKDTLNDRDDEDYNDDMRKYLIFDQVPSVSVQQLSKLEFNIEQEHTPVLVHEIQSSNDVNHESKYNPEVEYATNLDDVALLNLRTDAILNYVSDLTANEQKNNVIYEELRLGVTPPTAPVITTLMWLSESNKKVNHKVKDWRFLLTEGELFSDAKLPKGLAL
ncbi:hypothetical protein AKG98_1873 [Moritella sp. JT01]|uniref:hypothetical protein n=1 Tax=Moritella sp. JT01 TaxID=756698 RepID=UPI000793E202|nr:hypothetical protein [Moritella sp. JT01]KXO08277.1 hypothetical protein AKG98_1873 [Moritella sp. JT01]